VEAKFDIIIYIGTPGGCWNIQRKSPGCSKARVSLTDCRRKARESATENRQPMEFMLTGNGETVG